MPDRLVCAAFPSRVRVVNSGQLLALVRSHGGAGTCVMHSRSSVVSHRWNWGLGIINSLDRLGLQSWGGVSSKISEDSERRR
jgi:hypothetical protein